MTNALRSSACSFQGVRCAIGLAVALAGASACSETVTYAAVDADVVAVGPAVADGDSLLISVTIYDLDGGQAGLTVSRREGTALVPLPASEVLASSLGPYGLRRRQPETVWVRWTPPAAPSGSQVELLFAVADSDDPGLSLVVDW